LPHKLVVVGRPGWKFQSILKKIEAHKDLVIYLNHVSDADRLVIMRKAEMLALPSFYEGFGMQILEAFECSVPVATSNVSSMPEVAADAAVYFNPKDVVDIKNTIKAVLMDRSLRERLVGQGRVRLGQFSWERCAKETLAVLTAEK
jgi:glycosyltransferase involved in cell wall biosynthesis